MDEGSNPSISKIKIMKKITLRRAQISKSKNGVDVTVKSATIDWARKLAPTWEMVSQHKSGNLSNFEYIKLYNKILKKADEEGVFEELYNSSNSSQTLLCYCPGGKFCHTHLIIDYAIKKYSDKFKDGRRSRIEKGTEMKYLLAIDLETTGLKASYHEITQIGAILLNKELEELGQFETLVSIDYPERGMENGFNVFQYTHINSDDLKKAPKLKQSLRSLELFVRGKAGFNLDSIAIFGQNPRFDVTFIEKAYDSLGWKFPYDFHPIGLESMYTFYTLQKTGKLPNQILLKTICKKAGVENVQEHNALADIRATVDAMKALLGK